MGTGLLIRFGGSVLLSDQHRGTHGPREYKEKDAEPYEVSGLTLNISRHECQYYTISYVTC